MTLPEGTHLSPGDLIELEVPHCDPTVNLYDFIHVMRGDELVAICRPTPAGRRSYRNS